jgi:Zn-dependent M28 family amino/carboxypeptidase
MRPLVALAALAAVVDSPQDQWWAHVQTLASDEMKGRDAGSPQHKKAARYVAAQFREAGLVPCSGSSFLQPVPLVRRSIREDRSGLSLLRGGAEREIELGRTAVMSLRATGRATRPVQDAEAVFVGYGLAIPELGYDDFAGLDLKGKVAVYLSGGPRSIPGPVLSHFNSTAERGRAMRSAGAVGVIALTNPRNADTSWETTVRARLNPAMAIQGAKDASDGIQFAAQFNPAEAGLLFQGTAHELPALIESANKGERLPRFELPFRVRARLAQTESATRSDNVCGKLAGSGPESVALTAHLDHIGTGAPINGDGIYNGAMDNASGIATLIEVARALRGRSMRRSILFVALTAEEKGLLGSRYFAEHMPAGVVANINFDMYLPIHRMRKLMVLGLAESDLGASLEPVARAAGVELQPDNEPARNRFIRSDQYSFILRGVPSVALKVGFDAGTPEEKLQREWTANRYHKPADDLAQPVDRDTAVLFNRIVEGFAAAVADQPSPPRWNESSFFKRFAPR